MLQFPMTSATYRKLMRREFFAGIVVEQTAIERIEHREEATAIDAVETVVQRLQGAENVMSGM